MRKTLKIFIFVAALPLAACAGAPDSQDFLADASATCGASDLFKPERTFINAPGPLATNQTYGCVDSYLKGRSEYQDTPSDRMFIATVRQIDLLRGSGQLTPAQAQAQMQEAVAKHAY